MPILDRALALGASTIVTVAHMMSYKSPWIPSPVQLAPRYTKSGPSSSQGTATICVVGGHVGKHRLQPRLLMAVSRSLGAATWTVNEGDPQP